ncbi:MAG TPA: response regulator transcription factor [Dehalococcoidia bacterium]|nr:response regulator transcription factor [Dehalococcoidia bacterium]
MPALLLITADAAAEDLIRRGLGSLGYEVVTTASCDEAIRALFKVKIDAVVIDTSLGEDVEWLCQRLRGADGALPVVFLAAPSVQWLPGSVPLRPGLDEMVVRPYSGRDVLQAVERALAASHRSRSNVVLIGDLQLDRTSHEIRGGGVQVQLTPTEFRLMEFLAQRQGSITSSEELLEKVWEFFPGTGSSELVRSHIRNLRAKLRIAVPDRDLIQTVPRRGYRLV